MKCKISFFQIIILSSLIILSLTKPKKNKNKKGKKSTTLPNGLPTPDSVRPSYVIPELFCETCRAIVNEALKELRAKTAESDVYDYLSKACEESRYTSYEYIPKDIERTCGIFMGIYEEEIVKLLTKRKIDAKNKEIISNFCDDYTQVCKGVEVNYEKSFEKIQREGEYDVGGMPLTIDIHSSDEKKERKDKKKERNNKKHKNKNKEKRKIKKNRKNKADSDL